MTSLPVSSVERLHRQFEPVLAMVEAADVELLSERPEPGKWSIHENLAHLGRYQEVFQARIELLLTAAKPPTFARYVADDDSGFVDWVTRPPATLRVDFRRDRFTLASHLLTLSATELCQTARHPVYGCLDVVGWTEFFLLHEAHHLFTILRLLGPAQPLAQG